MENEDITKRVIANALEAEREKRDCYERGEPEPALDNVDTSLTLCIAALEVLATFPEAAKTFAEELQKNQPEQFDYLSKEV
jgi:hypothetical protein